MAMWSLTVLQCPVLIAWGEKDPWEPIDLGRAYSNFDAVEDFVVLPGAGHCPQVKNGNGSPFYWKHFLSLATFLMFV